MIWQGTVLGKAGVSSGGLMYEIMADSCGILTECLNLGTGLYHYLLQISGAEVLKTGTALYRVSIK